MRGIRVMVKSGAPLRILVLNDDGIEAPGIALLEKTARQFSDDVWVVAPDGERSGAGHSLSMVNPLRVRQQGERRFAVTGTPTDCALLGVYELVEGRRPDVILSGINRGPNLAEDITYSGTASAAMEGALLGIPAIALSQIITYTGEIHWPTAEKYAPEVIARLLDMPWKQGQFVNVNFPNCPPDQVAGIRVTSQGMRPPGAFQPVRRVDERHVPYYWIKIAHPEGGHAPGNDLQAALDNEVSVTPMMLDMTDHAALAGLRQRFAG